MNWIRKHIFWIAGTAVAGMILWLVASSAVSVQSAQGESVGTLFGRPVAPADYLKSLQAVTHQAILTHGDHFRQHVSLDELEAQAWERLTFVEEAKRKGIRVTDREVVKEIQGLPLFHNSDRQFDERGYQVVMQYTLGTTPRVFEEETRENLMIQKMVQQVIGAPTAGEEEIKADKEVIAQKRLRNYLAWYQELLKRANPQKKGVAQTGG